MYFDTWNKLQEQKLLTPLESLVADVIRLHPEYQKLFSISNAAIDKDFVDSNPFLHMSLHIALREQIKANTPPDAASIYEALSAKGTDPHDIEHQMIECLAEALWTSQQLKQAPDPALYIDCLRRLL